MGQGVSGVLDLLILVAAGLGLVWASARLAVLLFVSQLRVHRPFQLRRGYPLHDDRWESVSWIAGASACWATGLSTGPAGSRS